MSLHLLPAQGFRTSSPASLFPQQFSLEQPGLASHFLGPNLLLSFSLYHFMTSISKLVGSVLKKSGLYQLLSTSTAPTLVYATVIGAIG